ncbi:bifunctional adenosylcobinamide kinase/adenosylcobinamide-phosphate guanylyltransferase [Gluconobacter japonicus]|uniref:bifunctional adenosylcobinamide kinase/adenosylcobinamide-phosphate guanylyltransferase n=1 Tax=Gluconobacter japonicus TaxID=376620 RepID=UPI001B8A9F3E|nr:bifunctional adenosylcobinamide kinase/adenosylcobinamide-phosphate guanylyltransferase [Gluconobacter japonicus]MBS1050995.1 bifunctional adenosylcobinamide kinase/adenosylcobinamide-phosphate guanylyltransferase [Gluconobacter japonicus]
MHSDGPTGQRQISLVLGGARSGKSGVAEALVTSQPAPWIYLATGRAYDEEMHTRIALHRVSRGALGWQTIEEPYDIAKVIRNAGPEPVLVDCLTLWLTNLILDGRDVSAATEDLLSALSERAHQTVLVSNEVGLGIVPENALARRFRDEAGLLHQRIAAIADEVLFVAAGLSLKLK